MASSTLPLRRVAVRGGTAAAAVGTAEERASRNSERTAFVARQAQPPGLVSGTSLVLTLAFRRLHLEDGREAQSTPRNVRVFLTKAREIKLRTLCTQKRKTHVIYYDSISNVECWLLQLRSNTTVGAHGAVPESRQSARSDVRRHPPATTPAAYCFRISQRSSSCACVVGGGGAAEAGPEACELGRHRLSAGASVRPCRPSDVVQRLANASPAAAAASSSPSSCSIHRQPRRSRLRRAFGLLILHHRTILRDGMLERQRWVLAAAAAAAAAAIRSDGIEGSSPPRAAPERRPLLPPPPPPPPPPLPCGRLGAVPALATRRRLSAPRAIPCCAPRLSSCASIDSESISIRLPGVRSAPRDHRVRWRRGGGGLVEHEGRPLCDHAGGGEAERVVLQEERLQLRHGAHCSRDRAKLVGVHVEELERIECAQVLRKARERVLAQPEVSERGQLANRARELVQRVGGELELPQPSESSMDCVRYEISLETR